MVFYMFLCRYVSWFLYGPFCHGALKLDISTLFTTFFLLTTSLQFIFRLTDTRVYIKMHSKYNHVLKECVHFPTRIQSKILTNIKRLYSYDIIYVCKTRSWTQTSSVLLKIYKRQIKGTPGFEPGTSRSAVECSTTELYPLWFRYVIQVSCMSSALVIMHHFNNLKRLFY